MIRIRFELPPGAAVSTAEKHVFAALVEGHHRLHEIAQACELTELAVIDALASLGSQMLVIWRAGRPYFRYGTHYLDSNGKRFDCV